MELNNVTVARNSANAADGEDAVGGIYTSTGSNSNLFLQNSIVADNSGATAPDCAAAGENPIESNAPGYNILGDNTGCQFDAASTDIVGDVQNGASPIDPGLADLAANGDDAANAMNATLTHALTAASPAIDAGDPNVPGGGGTCATTDQRGTARPVDGDGDGGAVCDIGAFEAPMETVMPGGGADGSGDGADGPVESTDPSDESVNDSDGGGGAFTPTFLTFLLLAAYGVQRQLGPCRRPR